MKEQVDQVEAISPRTERAIAEQVSEVHQRPVIVRRTSHPLIGKNVSGKNLPQMTEVADVRIVQDLAIVVVHEAVAQGVKIRQHSEDKEKTHRRRVVTRETRHPLHKTRLRNRLLEVQSFFHRNSGLQV